MKFKVGQKWRTRGGDVVTVTEIDETDEDWPVLCDDGVWRHRKGYEWFDHDTALDLTQRLDVMAEATIRYGDHETTVELEADNPSQFQAMVADALADLIAKHKWGEKCD